jgi:hypothetical protein
MDVKKTVQRYAVVLLLAVAGGFLGSSFHEWIRADSEVVRAKRYEVIGASGKILSYWGPDSNPSLPAETPKGIILVFLDADGVRRAQIGSGIGSYAPELLFYGREGRPENGAAGYSPEPRFRIGLGYNEDPFLTMRDRRARRVLLGAYHGDPRPGGG